MRLRLIPILLLTPFLMAPSSGPRPGCLETSVREFVWGHPDRATDIRLDQPVDLPEIGPPKAIDDALATLGYKKVNDRAGTGYSESIVLAKDAHGNLVVVKMDSRFPRSSDKIKLQAEVKNAEAARAKAEANAAPPKLNWPLSWLSWLRLGKPKNRLPPKPNPFLKSKYLEPDGLPLVETEFFPRRPGSEEPAWTLRKWMTDAIPKMSIPERQALFEQIVDAVAVAEEAGIIHRDLKPENILINDAGEVKIIDWGISAMPGEMPAGQDVGTISGTYLYMSPDAYLGKVASPADDIAGLRRLAWDILGAGHQVEGKVDHMMTKRLFGTHTEKDYKHAPEIAGLDPKYATAAWSAAPKTVARYRDLLRSSQSHSFERDYAEALSGRTPEQIAEEILGSRTAIEKFPPRGMDPKLAGQVVRAARKIYEDFKDHTTPLPFGPHAYLYYPEFFKRVETVARYEAAAEFQFIALTTKLPAESKAKIEAAADSAVTPADFYPVYFTELAKTKDRMLFLTELTSSTKLRQHAAEFVRMLTPQERQDLIYSALAINVMRNRGIEEFAGIDARGIRELLETLRATIGVHAGTGTRTIHGGFGYLKEFDKAGGFYLKSGAELKDWLATKVTPAP